jgi:hypothetical protein
MQGTGRIYSLAYSEATSSKPEFMLTNVPSLGPGRYTLVPRRRNKANGIHGIVSATAAVRAAGDVADTGNDEDEEVEDADEDEDDEDVEEVEAGQDAADDEDGAWIRDEGSSDTAMDSSDDKPGEPIAISSDGGQRENPVSSEQAAADAMHKQITAASVALTSSQSADTGWHLLIFCRVTSTAQSCLPQRPHGVPVGAHSLVEQSVCHALGVPVVQIGFLASLLDELPKTASGLKKLGNLDALVRPRQ